MRASLTLAFGLTAFLCSAAMADEPNPVIGKWIEKLPNGNQVVTEFTDTVETSTPLDSTGKPIAAPVSALVSYRKINSDAGMGDGYTITSKQSDGKLSSVNVYLKDNDNLIIDFPGTLGAHHMMRLSTETNSQKAQ